VYLLAKWYTLAAEQGLVGAQYALAYNYEKGIGVATNYKTAIKWYTQSAGFYYSQYRLGDMYFKGRCYRLSACLHVVEFS